MSLPQDKVQGDIKAGMKSAPSNGILGPAMVSLLCCIELLVPLGDIKKGCTVSTEGFERRAFFSVAWHEVLPG